MGNWVVALHKKYRESHKNISTKILEILFDNLENYAIITTSKHDSSIMITNEQLSIIKKLQAHGAEVSIDDGNPPRVAVRIDTDDEEIVLFTDDAWDVIDELEKLVLHNPDIDRDTLALIAVYPFIEDAVQ